MDPFVNTLSNKRFVRRRVENVFPPDHVDDLTEVEPNQPDLAPAILEPALADKNKEPEEEEELEEKDFEDEETQEEEDIEVDIGEEENEPELMFSYEEANPLNLPPLMTSDNVYFIASFTLFTTKPMLVSEAENLLLPVRIRIRTNIGLAEV
uniref:Uncharacterized protein n=1 Tax=Tanacetum cinerariifolium TaxID=118510 RepID=A0A6L2MY69_TANCI|nr:hypothetical protein [Tanacetum cinerariifolium]